jgi:hypothetical protein
MGTGKITDVFVRKQRHLAGGDGYPALVQMVPDLLHIAGVPEYGFPDVYDHIIAESMPWRSQGGKLL